MELEAQHHHRRPPLAYITHSANKWKSTTSEADCNGVIGFTAGSVGPDDGRDTFTEESLAAESDAQIEAATAESIGPVKDFSNRCSNANSNCWMKCPWWLRSPVSCAMNEYRS